MLANCVSLARLYDKEDYRLDQIRDDEPAVEIQINDEHVVEDQSDDESVVEIQIEENQAENHENEIPFVGQPQVVYDVEEDDDIQITFSSITPRHQIPADYKERAKRIKK